MNNNSEVLTKQSISLADSSLDDSSLVHSGIFYKHFIKYL